MNFSISQRITLETGLLELSFNESLFPPENIFDLASRANLKRGFLFVSKILGKHYPTDITTSKPMHDYLIEQLIGATIPDNNEFQDTVFICMAETAVGLGYRLFSLWQQIHTQSTTLFLQTTRYRVENYEALNFSEDHSHAPQQWLHMPKDNALNIFCHAKNVVLVDDEVSTGNTFINLLKQYQKYNSNIANVHIVTLTDFMGDQQFERVKQAFDFPIERHALLFGNHHFTANQETNIEIPIAQHTDVTPTLSNNPWGRTGCLKAIDLNQTHVELIDELTKNIDIQQDAKPCLILGIGEFMQGAYLLAEALETKGIKTYLQATTRSPILVGRAIQHKLDLPDPYQENIPYYLYNVRLEDYQTIFICHETPLNQSLRELSQTLNAQLIYFKDEQHIEKISLC